MSGTGIRIQPDWDKSILEKDKNIWFHIYDPDQTRYQKIEISENNLSADLECVDCRVVSSKAICLRDTTRYLQSTFQCPDVRFTTIHKQKREPTLHVNAFDVNTSGELAVSAASDKNVLLWETKTGEVRRSFSGHVSDVYCCKFFPSGLVVLTGGSDMQLKVWCAVSGRCAATLKPGMTVADSSSSTTTTTTTSNAEPGGHRSAIVDVDFIERGKNIVSLDRGGWLRLWDVSTQIAISAVSVASRSAGAAASASVAPSTYANCALDEAPHCCAVKHRIWDPTPPETIDDPNRHFCGVTLETNSPTATSAGVTDKLVTVGSGGGGRILVYDITSSESRRQGPVLELRLPGGTGAVTACATAISATTFDAGLGRGDCRGGGGFDEFGIAGGGANGEVALWDLRQPSKPVLAYEAYKSGVCALKMCSFPSHSVEIADSTTDVDVPAFTGLLTAFRDGRVILRQLTADRWRDGYARCVELTGPDVDAIRGVTCVAPTSQRCGVSVWTGTNTGHFYNYRRVAVEYLFV